MEPLLQVLEVQGQLAHADGVALANRFVPLPASYPVAFQGQQFLDEHLLCGAVLLGVQADRELLLLDLPGLDEGLEVNAPPWLWLCQLSL